MKKIISMVLSFILILGCSTTAFAAETHNYDTENLPHDGADYFETEIKADEENEERISDFVTVYGYQYTNYLYPCFKLEIKLVDLPRAFLMLLYTFC